MNESLATKAGDPENTPADYTESGQLAKDPMTELLELSDSEESDHGE